MSLTVKIDASQISRMKAAIQDTGRNLRKELVIAVNQTAKQTKSAVAKELSKELNLKQKVVARAVKIGRTATGQDITSEVEVNKEKRFNLTSFGAQEVASGVQYKTLKSKPKKIAKSAFQIDRWGGKTFVRVGKARGPLRNLKGPSPWGIFVVGKKIGPSADQAEAALKKNIDKRIRFLLLKKSGTI